MMGLNEWVRDLLLSHGALVETEDTGALRALLPADLSQKLGASDWLSLHFGASAGADDPGEWLERLGSLLPSRTCVIGARLRQPALVPQLDAEAVLGRELVIQNGIYRLVEDHCGAASYFFFAFQYTIESDERSFGRLTVGLNASSRSLPRQAESLLRAIENDLEEDPAFRIPVEAVTEFYPAAARTAQAEISSLASGLEHSANRRLARDSERVDSYYRGLLAQIRKRSTRREADPQAVEKERSRAEATELDRAAKLEDLLRKYSLRIQLQLTDVLVVPVPVSEIAVRLIRKKDERLRVFHWNSVLRSLDSPLCESCYGRAHPLYLCEKVHCLCSGCWTCCPHCSRFFCRACQASCKCKGAARS